MLNKLSFARITALGCLLIAPVWGQVATGTITGNVTDESGAVIPSAAITISNKATGAVRSLTANTDGLDSAPSLQAGDYEVRAEMWVSARKSAAHRCWVARVPRSI
jgi:hypothetical protein